MGGAAAMGAAKTHQTAELLITLRLIALSA